MSKEIIFLLTSLCIITFAWIGFNLRHDATTSTIQEALIQDSTDINPTFNSAVIAGLKQRQLVDPLYSLSGGQSSATTSASLTPTPTQLIQVTPSSLTPTPVATVTPGLTTIPVP